MSIQIIKNKLDQEMKIYPSKVAKAEGSKQLNMVEWQNETKVLFNLFLKDVETAWRTFFCESDFPNTKICHHRYQCWYGTQSKSTVWELQTNGSCRGRHEREQGYDGRGINVRFSVNNSGNIRKTASTNQMLKKIGITYSFHKDARNFQDSLKILLAYSSAEANISPHQESVAFKVYSKLFGVEHHLIPSSNPPVDKKPKTNRYYCRHENLICSQKTIVKMKHLMTIQDEKDANLALLNTLLSDRITLHYDTTMQKRLNGGWLSIVLKTSSVKKFCLRFLNMAVEYWKTL